MSSYTTSRVLRIAALLAVIMPVLWLAGCGQPQHADNRVTSRDVQFDKLPFHVVAVNLNRARLQLYWRRPDNGKPFGSISALQQWGAAHGHRLLFAANAGIYDAHREPLGLYVEHGKALVPLNRAHGDPRAGNFSLLPNGVFAIDADGRASVRTTVAYAKTGAHPRWATQSGPMLVIDGTINPHFRADSHSVRWRSGVCARTPTHVVFAISEAPVNFHTFARLFRDKLGCRNALYLDGTLSQFYVAGNQYGPPSLMVKPYAGMFAVFAPAKPDATP